jgi:hypothetical protein
MISVTLSTRRTSGGQSLRDRPKEHRSGCSPTAFNEILEADARSMVSASSMANQRTRITQSPALTWRPTYIRRSTDVRVDGVRVQKGKYGRKAPA